MASESASASALGISTTSQSSTQLVDGADGTSPSDLPNKDAKGGPGSPQTGKLLRYSEQLEHLVTCTLQQHANRLPSFHKPAPEIPNKPDLNQYQQQIIQYAGKLDITALRKALDTPTVRSTDFKIFLLDVARAFSKAIPTTEDWHPALPEIFAQSGDIDVVLNLLLQGALCEALEAEHDVHALDVLYAGYKKISQSALPLDAASNYLDCIRLTIEDIFDYQHIRYRKKFHARVEEKSRPSCDSMFSEETDPENQKDQIRMERGLARAFFLASAYNTQKGDPLASIAHPRYSTKERAEHTLLKQLFQKRTFNYKFDAKILQQILESPLRASMNAYGVSERLTTAAQTKLSDFTEEVCKLALQFDSRKSIDYDRARQAIGLVAAAYDFVEARRTDDYPGMRAAYLEGRALCARLPEHDATIKKRFRAFVGSIVGITAVPIGAWWLACHFDPSLQLVGQNLGATIGTIGSACFFTSWIVAYMLYKWMERNAIWSGPMETKYHNFFVSNQRMKMLPGENSGWAQTLEDLMTTRPAYQRE